MTTILLTLNPHLNKAVKRNLKRFPSDFMFQLSF
ncbi:MAG: ORF6N domain-containing protein [Prevotella sp.]|nr:ORF6N domain-containing protein [Prevotella sp.]